jgi:hypothetical protein
MTIPTWATPFTDNTSLIPASFLNDYVRTQLPKALDGTGGGTYSPSVVIEIQGTAGLKVNGIGTARRLQYGSESLTRVQLGPLENRSANTVSYSVISVAAGQVAYQHLDKLPDNSVLTAVSVYFLRTPTGVLPGTRVQAALFKTDVTTGAQTTVVADTQDPTATVITYEAHHGFSIAVGGTETVDSSKFVYHVRIKGELAGNTSAVVLYPVTATYTVTSQDKAP